MWLDDAVEAIRKHPITPDTSWLVATSMSMAVELTGALEREQQLHDRVAELELRLASHVEVDDVHLSSFLDRMRRIFGEDSDG
jgi:hypothetical protein